MIPIPSENEAIIMNSKHLIITLALFLCGFNNNAFALPVSALIDLHAEAVLKKLDGDTAVVTSLTLDSATDSWGTPLAPLHAAVSATAVDANQSLTVSGGAKATWGSDGNSGNVSFSEFGYSGEASFYLVGLRNNFWNYSFIADSDGVFSMIYDVSVVDTIGSDAFGLIGWDINWSGPGGGLLLANVFDPTAHGLFSRPIVAGQLYTVGLQGGPGLESICFPDCSILLSNHVQGSFDFTISPVPEPSAIILFLLGLIILNIFRRRQICSTNTQHIDYKH